LRNKVKQLLRSREKKEIAVPLDSLENEVQLGRRAKKGKRATVARREILESLVQEVSGESKESAEKSVLSGRKVKRATGVRRETLDPPGQEFPGCRAPSGLLALVSPEPPGPLAREGTRESPACPGLPAALVPGVLQASLGLQGTWGLSDATAGQGSVVLPASWALLEPRACRE